MKNKSVWDTYFCPSHHNTFVTQRQKTLLNESPLVPGPIFILLCFQLDSLRQGGHQVLETDATALLPREPHSDKGMGWDDPNSHHAKAICMIFVQNANYLIYATGLIQRNSLL